MSLDVGQLEERVGKAMAATGLPGAAIGVVHEGELLYAGGFGTTSVEEGGLAVNARTLFRIGSTTKPITGTVILSLAEAGLIDLDVPVRSYLPWLQLADPVATETVSLRHLLSHTSGLPTAADLHARRDPEGLEDYVRHSVPHLALVAPPGKVFCYSNPGVSIAGLVAEVAAAKRYTELVQEIVFDPLAMVRSTFDPTVAMTYPLAQSHSRTVAGDITVDHHYADAAWGYPAGFVISNVEELARFAAMLLGRGELNGTRVLAEASVAEMMRPHARAFLDAHSFYGLTIAGHRHKGRLLYGHGGAISGFGTLFELMPETRSAVIIMVNLPDPLLDPAGLAASIFDELAGLDSGPEEPASYQPSPEERRALVGVYAGAGGVARIRQTDDDELEVEFNGRTGPLVGRAADLYAAEQQPMPIVVGVVGQPGGEVEMLSVMGLPLARTTEDALPAPVPDDPLDAYVGTYESKTPPVRVEVFVEDDQLLIQAVAQGIPPDKVVLAVLGGRRFGTPLGALEFAPPREGSSPTLNVSGLALERRSEVSLPG